MRPRPFSLRAVTIITVIVPFSAIAAELWSGNVVGVTDGDTISVLVDRQERKVRLHGVDTPERGQPFATKAKQLTSDLAFGKEVRVEALDIDRYGRHVGVVHLADGRILNHELVRAGMAWWYEEYAPYDPTLKRLQDEARRSHIGLWGDKDPIPPWEHRSEKRGKDTKSAHSRPSWWRVLFTGGEARASSPEDNQDGMVFITATGKKYHTPKCRYARNGARTTFENARAQGYEACKACGGR